MKALRFVALILPVLLAVGGAWFLLGSVQPATTNAKLGDGWREPTKAEARRFHKVPEIGDRARMVPGSNGTEWEMKNRGSNEILQVHGHGLKNEKVQIEDRIAVGAGSRELKKELAAGNGDTITADDAPDWVVDDWPGDGTADPSGGIHCTNSGPRVEVVYMRPEIFDRRDQFAGMAEPLLSSISATAGHASYMHGGPRSAKLNVVCDGGGPKVTYVRVGRQVDTHSCGLFWLDDCPDDATPDEGDWTVENARMSVGEVADVLQDLDLWNDYTSYLVIWDGFAPCGGGDESECTVGTAWGQTAGDDGTDPDLSEPKVSMVPTSYWSGTGAMHELLHNMGAVQDSAPHNYNGGHCSDGIDIMCYGDAATTENPDGYAVESGCENDSPQIVDCGGDDYFNPLPKPGSYLAGHRNIADLGYFTFSGTPRCSGWDGSRLRCSVGAIDGEVVDEDRGPAVTPPTRDPGLANVPAG